MTKYTKYEKARMLGSRALQIAMGAPFLVKLSESDLEKIGYNPVEIAKIEFSEGVLPITVRRPLPGEKFQEDEGEQAEEKEAA
ncbi:DNA-directed RNA polymerase subunit K [Candidatus Woesearchaeota archaeon]|nr:DNA-directed RNA polymerase subunit K [Candidatus Woesearchaeota archaeon]